MSSTRKRLNASAMGGDGEADSASLQKKLLEQQKARRELRIRQQAYKAELQLVNFDRLKHGKSKSDATDGLASNQTALKRQDSTDKNDESSASNFTSGSDETNSELSGQYTTEQSVDEA